MKRALIALAAVALVTAGCGTQTSSDGGPAEAPLTPCPTGTTTAKKLANLDCRVTRLESPGATVTASPTGSPSASPSATAPPTSPSPTSPTSTATPPPSSGFPDATNTGVPAGTLLTAYTGACNVSAPTTIDAKTITCPSGLVVQAANVVIRNSKVVGRIVVDTDVNRTWSLTLTDSEVDAGSGDLPAIYNGNVTILRANIHGGHNGLECQEHSSWCSLKDSWIHDQWQAASGDTHLGGFLDLGSVVPCTGPDANGVPACVELVHNTITCDAPVNSSGGGCTGDINLINHFGPLHGALIVGNLLGANIGAAYCTYGSAGFEFPADHIVYRDNVFQRGSNGKCANYGPVTNFDSGAVGNEWTRNVWDDGGTVSPN